MAKVKARVKVQKKASVGEIMSIIPIIRILEKNNKVQKILLTSTTTSSASIVKKIKFRKTEHVYFPIDEKQNKAILSVVSSIVGVNFNKLLFIGIKGLKVS